MKVNSTRTVALVAGVALIAGSALLVTDVRAGRLAAAHIRTSAHNTNVNVNRNVNVIDSHNHDV